MHTLMSDPVNKGKYIVIFEIQGVRRAITPNLDKDEAMSMANFLNGGLGHKYEKNVDVFKSLLNSPA